MQGNANSRAEKPVLNQDHTGMEPEKEKSRKAPPGKPKPATPPRQPLLGIHEVIIYKDKPPGEADGHEWP